MNRTGRWVGPERPGGAGALLDHVLEQGGRSWLQGVLGTGPGSLPLVLAILFLGARVLRGGGADELLTLVLGHVVAAGLLVLALGFRGGWHAHMIRRWRGEENVGFWSDMLAGAGAELMRLALGWIFFCATFFGGIYLWGRLRPAVAGCAKGGEGPLAALLHVWRHGPAAGYTSLLVWCGWGAVELGLLLGGMAGVSMLLLAVSGATGVDLGTLALLYGPGNPWTWIGLLCVQILLLEPYRVVLGLALFEDGALGRSGRDIAMELERRSPGEASMSKRKALGASLVFVVTSCAGGAAFAQPWTLREMEWEEARWQKVAEELASLEHPSWDLAWQVFVNAQGEDPVAECRDLLDLTSDKGNWSGELPREEMVDAALFRAQLARDAAAGASVELTPEQVLASVGKVGRSVEVPQALASARLSLRQTVLSWLQRFWEWLQRILDNLLPTPKEPSGSSGGFLRGDLFYWAAVVLLLTVLASLCFLFRSKRVPAPAHSGTVPGLVDQALDHSEEEWLRRALAFEQAGDLSEAVRTRYLALLLALSQSGRLPLHTCRTNGELLRRFQGGREARGSMSLATRSFEDTIYGHKPVGSSRYTRFLRDVERVLQGGEVGA